MRFDISLGRSITNKKISCKSGFENVHQRRESNLIIETMSYDDRETPKIDFEIVQNYFLYSEVDYQDLSY
jgi:hypothetical protein